jgi:hypothetical protein
MPDLASATATTLFGNDGKYSLFRVNLPTATATVVGQFGDKVVDIAMRLDQ